MFEKNMRLAFLLDFYGEILDEHSRGVMKAYYEDDLSLAEIADGIGISRQGVRHIIKKSEEQLEFFEKRLKLAERSQQIDEAIEILSGIADELAGVNSPTYRHYSIRINEAISKISDKSTK